MGKFSVASPSLLKRLELGALLKVAREILS